MQRVFSLPQKQALALQSQAVLSTADCDLPVSPRLVLSALIELMNHIPREELNARIIDICNRTKSKR